MTLPVSGIGVAVLAAIIGLVCGVVLYRTVTRLLHRIKLRRRFTRGAQGEKDAETFLMRHGYRIIEAQARREVRMTVDGAPVIYEVRADFIAKKRDKTYVVEVKTGAKAIDPAATDTRRQLLEYALAYEADAIRLFDADARVLHKIEFSVMPGKAGRKKNLLLAVVTAAAVVAAVVAWVMRMVAN